MSFDQDAFISYAHIDNEPLTPGQKGWVSQFHATLQAMLSQRMGEKARIWRDDKLDGNDVFSDEIVEQFAKTALLVSILSPRYVRSEWCTRELREFCEAAAHTGGVTIGNKSRVFKVIKTPFETAAPLPEAVQQTLGYEFYALDNGEPQELDPAFGDQARQQFLSKLSRLAWELAKSLQQLAQSRPAPGADTTGPARKVVFLADCGRDLRDAREQLATELRMHGHEVLPALQLPLAEDALVPELKAQLERCALAIHLVGGSVGPVPDGPSGRSLAMLENQLAAERCRQGALHRIIWLPAGVSGERAEQQDFIDALQRDTALQYGADLLRGDIEALKGAMHLTLRQLDTPATPVVAPAGQQIVHVLMSEADRAASVLLLKLLRAQGLGVTIPVFVGDAGALREANTQLLSSCDALVLFYGAGDEVWKFHQQSELRKQGAAGVAGRRHSEWTCLAPPSTADKQMLQQLEEPNLIDALTGFSAATLQPLLTALAATKAGP
ncbi:MAG: TIR domain-containing protein [Comamonadaceae bacterium]|nr:TIR domain-containing protein [Comamonadaceae bacterium]